MKRQSHREVNHSHMAAPQVLAKDNEDTRRTTTTSMDSGFISSRFESHTTPLCSLDIAPPIMKDNLFRFSTVDESRLNKPKQFETEMPLSFRAEDPQENMTIGSEHEYVSESSDDESTLDLSARYRTVTPPFLRTKSLPRTGIGKLFMPEPYHKRMAANVKVERLQTDKKGLGMPFKPEPYLTRMAANVKVERLQTDKKEGIPRREISYLSTFSLPPPMEETWQGCISYSRNLERDAKKLLLKGILPDDILLQSICKIHGRKSRIIRYITNSICQNIKEQSNNIIQVWPAFRYGNDLKNSENYIIFVVIMETHTDIKTDYQIYERNVNEILSLSKKENDCIRDNEKLSDVRINDITLCLKSNASRLMETHKNLTCVTISRVKSSRHGRGYRIVKSLCIALFVQVKGFIPIDEDPFEQFIDKYPVDVREGVFTLCGSPTDLHQNVRMGCALDSGFGTNQGTIGPFFRYETDSDTYLLTSAHVLLDYEQMQRLIVDKEVYYGMFGTNTYQPPESILAKHNSRHHLGKLEFAVYREGGQYMPGMEVALVRINESRIPKDGKFPSKPGETEVEFFVEDICTNPSLLYDPYVYKYGSTTGLTRGKLRLQGTSVRSKLDGKHLGLDIPLHNQIEIEPVDGVAFGDLGDSGSLVFKTDGKRLFAVGIFEGKLNDHTYMVTPILEMERALSEFMSRYRYPPTHVNEQNSAVTLKLYYVPPSRTVPLSAGIDRQISDAISKQTTEMQTNILHYTDHKIDSVKTELETVKAQNTRTQEIIENLSSQISSLSHAVMRDRLQMQ